MTIQDAGADLIKGRLYCMNLVDHVNALLVVLKHLLNAADMPFNRLQPLNIFCMIVHHFLTPEPPGGGWACNLTKFTIIVVIKQQIL